MSKLENSGESSNKFKRKPESDDEDDEIRQLTNQNKKILLDANEANGNADDEAANKKRILVEAMKKIEKIKSEMNKLNNSQDDEEEFSSDENEEFNVSDNDDDYSSDDELFQSNLLMSAEALGFAMCAQETFKFLHSYGIDPNDPIYIDLKNKLIGPNRK